MGNQLDMEEVATDGLAALPSDYDHLPFFDQEAAVLKVIGQI